jgi:hypothetical protein
VQNDALERLATLRDDEQPDGGAAGHEDLLDRAPTGDELFLVPEQSDLRRCDRPPSGRRPGTRSGSGRTGRPGTVVPAGRTLVATWTRPRTRPRVGLPSGAIVHSGREVIVTPGPVVASRALEVALGPVEVPLGPVEIPLGPVEIPRRPVERRPPAALRPEATALLTAATGRTELVRRRAWPRRRSIIPRTASLVASGGPAVWAGPVAAAVVGAPVPVVPAATSCPVPAASGTRWPVPPAASRGSTAMATAGAAAPLASTIGWRAVVRPRPRTTAPVASRFLAGLRPPRPVGSSGALASAALASAAIASPSRRARGPRPPLAATRPAAIAARRVAAAPESESPAGGTTGPATAGPATARVARPGPGSSLASWPIRSF